jgi:hypothetical protein
MAKPKAPDPPDYVGAAKQQGEENLNAAIAQNVLGRVGQVGPNGSLTYRDVGSYTLPNGTVIPISEAVTTLSPEQQRLYDQNAQISGNLNDLALQGIDYVGSTVNKPFAMDELAQLRRSLPGSQDYGAQRDEIVQALLSRMNPELDRQEGMLKTGLANKGLDPGSEAYKAEMNLMDQRRNDALTSAVLAGGAEQTRMQGMDLTAAEFEKNARAQGIQEQSFFRNDPLNTLNALRTGNQVNMPQFMSTPSAGVQAAPIYDATADRYQSEMQNFQTRMAAYNSLMGGLASIAGAGIGGFLGG